MSDFDPVAAFNAANPVGTLVNFWPGDRREDAWTARTRTPAWYMGRFPVVSVEGYAGGISLTHVQPVHEPADSELIACPHWEPGKITMRKGCTACAATPSPSGFQS